jgi:hypothetical protein
MPDDFAESAEGVLLAANGVDPVVRWDGYLTQAIPAGIAGPADAPALAGSGSGSITGKYRAFVRFLDAAGNVSNLSPVSDEASLIGNGQVDYTGVAVPASGRVTRRQVLRNTDGQYAVFYVDVDTADLTSTTLTGLSTDAELAAGEAVPLLDPQGRPLADRYDPPPSTKPFLAFHLNRMWAAGEQPYAEGSAAVVRFSAAVAGYGTNWPASLAGRFFYVPGASRSYEIAAVDPVAQTLTLAEPWEDAGDPFAEYAVRPAPAEAGLVYFSEAGLPEAWPPTNALSLPEDGDEVTALMPYRSFLYVLKRRQMYRVTAQADPLLDGFVFRAVGRGCVNHRSWVVVEQTAYLMDEAGVYRFSGGDEAEVLSTPVQNLFRRDDPRSICWAAARYFHAAYDPSQEVIRWYVSLRGEYLPRHALCLAYNLGRWWVEEYAVPVGASCVGRAGRPTGGWGDAGRQVYLGGPAGAVYAAGGQDLDGVDPGPTTRGACTAATDDTLTDSRAAFDPAWANVPVAVTGGRGLGQVRVVVSATATTLRVGEPWSTRPDATSTYQVGGIRYRYLGQRLRYVPTEDRDGRSVELTFQPLAAPADLWLRLYHDFAATPVVAGREVGPGQRGAPARVAKAAREVRVDLSHVAGVYWQRFDGHREGGTDSPRHVTVELQGVAGPERVRLGSALLNGMA